jgi:hypothetical protein
MKSIVLARYGNEYLGGMKGCDHKGLEGCDSMND